ncbi:MAG: glycosyltransferase [Candidatus Paceibacterota bacterium]|jgi:polypeptide N-acetylgalactosaminyltransferase
MPTATIIMSVLNEEYTEKTIDTIIANTMPGLIDEFIIVDDCSKVPVVIDRPNVRVIRNQLREGLQRSRNTAAAAAKSPVIVSIDAHVKVAPNWLLPIVNRLTERYNCVGVPLTRGLDAPTWTETTAAYAKTGWRWNLDFNWIHDDGTDNTPCLAGHCFAFTKQWWEEIGGFDTGMYKWGCENIEFSLRTWMAGGSVEIIRDSVVAHWFKNKFNYDLDTTTLEQNKARIAEVWFGDYKKFFYQAIRKKPGDIKFGDISERIVIRDRIQKRPFQWFLDNFLADLSKIEMLKNRHANTRIAVLGAGPSLDLVTKGILDDFDVVIGVNWNALVFDCDYVVFHDLKPAESVMDAKRYLPNQLFIPKKLKTGAGKTLVEPQEKFFDCITYELGPQDRDSCLNNKDQPFFHHASTVHTAIHIAAFLGAKSITLFGCDARLAPDGRSHTTLVPQYNKGKYWPDNKDTENYIARINRGYDMLLPALKKWNISLLRYEYMTSSQPTAVPKSS